MFTDPLFPVDSVSQAWELCPIQFCSVWTKLSVYENKSYFLEINGSKNKFFRKSELTKFSAG